MNERLSGKRILVLEDDALLAMDMEDFLTDLGCQVVGPVSTVSAALILAEGCDLDGAVLDLNLRGELSLPVIEDLRKREVPFVVCSGYAELNTIRGELANVTLLSKPCDFSRLDSVLEKEFCLSRQQARAV